MAKISFEERERRVAGYCRARAAGQTIREAGNLVGVKYQTAKTYERMYREAAKTGGDAGIRGVMNPADCALILSATLRRTDLDTKHIASLTRTLLECLRMLRRAPGEAGSTPHQATALAALMQRWGGEAAAREGGEGAGSPPESDGEGDITSPPTPVSNPSGDQSAGE